MTMKPTKQQDDAILKFATALHELGKAGVHCRIENSMENDFAYSFKIEYLDENSDNHLGEIGYLIFKASGQVLIENARVGKYTGTEVVH